MTTEMSQSRNYTEAKHVCADWAYTPPLWLTVFQL